MRYIIYIPVSWSEEKNELLKATRGVSFEEVVAEIEAGRLLALLPHPSRPNQKIYIIRLRSYVHAVPFIEEADGTIFLKTIYRTRKGQKHFGGMS